MTDPRRWVRLFWLWPASQALLSSLVYFLQGGFGGGDGHYDWLLLVLGLPWSLCPLPAVFHSADLIWLVVVPFVFNAVLVAGLTLVLRKPSP